MIEKSEYKGKPLIVIKRSEDDQYPFSFGLSKAKLIVEGANIPITEGAEKYLYEKGVVCIPDFIANSGGVICAGMEYRGKIESEALEVIKDKVSSNTRLVLEDSRTEKITPREAAMNLAVRRVEKAMSFKRWSIY